MRRSKLFFRWLTAWLLLCMLGVGLLGGAGLSARAAPVQQAALLDVIINEVAWTGTAADSADEWIELHNPGASDINLAGWRLVAADGTPTINLTGIIAAGGYFLLERSDNNSVSDISADNIYTGALGDGGEALILYDNLNNIIDSANGNGGVWPSGATVSGVRYSMERISIIPDTDSNWGSNDGVTRNGLDAAVPIGNPINGTPKQQNSIFAPPPPPPPIEVLINEVAWAGTQASSDDDWIELHNPSLTDPVDISDWELISSSFSIAIPLNTIIPIDGYYLIERRQQATNVPSDLIFSSLLLGNSGDTLRLRRSDGSLVDTANLDGGGWPAGSSSSTATMQRGAAVADSDFAWVTYASSTGSDLDAGSRPILGTPGRENQPTNVTATATLGPTSTTTRTPTSTPTSTPTGTTTPPPGNVRSIVINEVAWAGTRASADDEWIELYNPGTAAINLSGWVLKSSDGSPTIELPNVNIAAGAYFLLERTDDNTVADITADQIYTGSLTNSGEILYLYDPADRIIDTANSTLPIFWPAGNPSDYSSMQRSVIAADSNFVWVTYDVTKDLPANYAHDAAGDPIRGTPRRANLPINVTATPTRVSTTTSGGGGSTGGIATPAPVIGISEFLPRPGHDWNNDGIVDVFDEFIEIINAGRGDINLSAYRLDDEQIGGSVPYTLPNLVLKPDERAVFYASETGILLSDAGDTVRLLRGNTVIDAYTYPVVRYPDQSWCRIPDRLGYWNDPCFPTPNNANALTGRIPLPSGGPTGYRPPVCLLPDTAPDEFIYAECEIGGDGIWNRQFWDGADAARLLTLGEEQKWETVFE